MLTRHRQTHAVRGTPHAAPVRLAAASALTLPQFPGTFDCPGEEIPVVFTIRSDATDEITDAALAMVDAGYLTPADWQGAGGNTKRAIELAVSRLATTIRTRPLADLNVVVTNAAAKVEIESEGCRSDSTKYYNQRHHANASQLGVIAVHTDHEKVWHAVIGPVLTALEKYRPGLGHAVLNCLNESLNLSCRGCTPVSAFGWAQSEYWMGENDESLWVEENIADAEHYHNEQQEKLPAAERKPFDPAQAAKMLNIFTRKDYDTDIPPWAGSEHFQRKPVFTPDQLRRLRVAPQWQAIVRAAATAGSLAENIGFSHLCDSTDLDLFEGGCWESVPFLLRWFRTTDKQDCLAQIYDDTLNHIFQCGERNLSVNSVFAFHDAASLVKALRRFEKYLQLVNAAEQLLVALKLKPV